ncbi:MAG TPA: Smr/MutS family protein [Hyphomicrobiales bacterium]|nr:Smr/MutS family protein [Hyphomicrobiales bacterium]
MSRSRGLRPDEAALWAQIVAGIARLDGRPPPASLREMPAPPPIVEPPSGAPPRRMAQKPAVLAPQTIDPRLARRLARGTAAVEGRLDLHGLTQAAAHRRLNAFLLAAQGRGERLVLVVTGKGRDVADADPLAQRRGVLRRLVPLWLADPALRAVVLGFGEAVPAHGGSGALYVRLKRKRP